MTKRTDTATAKAIAIAEMPDSRARTRAIERFHSDNYTLYEKVALRFRTKAGIARGEVEDLTQIVAMVADTIIRDPKPYRTGSMFSAVLSARCQSKLRDWSFSAEHTGIGGASGAKRREMMVARTARALATTLGRDPNVEEIVTAANEEMMNRRSNPGKSGRITERDVTGLRLMPNDFDTELLGGFDGPSIPGDTVLDPIELRPFAERIIEECTDKDPKLGELAEVFLSQFLSDDAGIEPSMKEMAQMISRSADWVRRSVHDIREIAREILRNELDIHDF